MIGKIKGDNFMINKKIIKYTVLLLSCIILFVSNSLICMAVTSSKDELRGMWISYLELKRIYEEMKDKKNLKEFSDKIEKMLEEIKQLNCTDVFFQVRPFSDALYDSKKFPTSHVLAGTQGEDIGYDPLKSVIELAHKKGLKVHGWVNPYRIKLPTNPMELSKNNPFSNLVDDTKTVIKYFDGVTTFNPANDKIQKLIIEGIEEIAVNYDIDGIHLDDYFYLSDNLNYDKDSYDEYLRGGGQDEQKKWRINNVNKLIKNIYSKVKEIAEERNKQILFGVSPGGNINHVINKESVDVKTWMKEPGYIDYIVPQIYYGFNNKRLSFNQALESWLEVERHQDLKMYIGLAAYKIGTEDEYAIKRDDTLTLKEQDDPRKEWITNHNIISKQILKTRESCNGFIFFRHDFLFNPPEETKSAVEEELKGINKVLEKK